MTQIESYLLLREEFVGRPVSRVGAVPVAVVRAAHRAPSVARTARVGPRFQTKTVPIHVLAIPRHDLSSAARRHPCESRTVREIWDTIRLDSAD
jgi:hypothetical protein